MAYERISGQKSRGEGLDVFVENTMKLFQNQLALRNAEEENEFNRAVIDNNLTIDDQLQYRKDQLKRVGDDPVERKRLRAEITTLTQRATAQKYSEEYLGRISQVSAGMTSLDSLISWLETQLAGASDPDLRLTISRTLAEKQAEKFTLTKQLLENQTQYAMKDNSVEIIDAQLARVGEARTKALLSGDATLASNYDLQIQALTKAKTESVIDKDMKNFAVSNITGYATATALLDSYNAQISAASPTGAVKIGDTTYASPQEFWKFKRDSYLADNSASGFFGRYNNEVNTDLKVKNSTGMLTTNDVKSAAQLYDQLLARPELVNYQQKVVAMKQDSLETGANFLSQKILNTYSRDYDLNTATTNLNALKALGVNTDDAYTKLITSSAAVKNSAVNNTLSAAQNILQANPTLTPEQALAQASKTGAGVVLSPEQLATKPVDQITKDFSAGAQGEKFNEDPRLTTPPAQGTTPPPVVPQPQPQPAPNTTQTGATPAQTNPTPKTPFTKQLTIGTNDSAVGQLQTFLNSQGQSLVVDNIFGAKTQAAVKQFQKSQGLVDDGIVGPKTLAALNKAMGI